jgi:hypothetical protein
VISFSVYAVSSICRYCSPAFLASFPASKQLRTIAPASASTHASVFLGLGDLREGHECELCWPTILEDIH